MSANGNRPWGQIKEVDGSKMTRAYGRWRALYQEVALRLEQTPKSKALEVPFEDAELAKAARSSVAKYFYSYHGAGFVTSSVTVNGKGATLYVTRGPNYK